MGIGTQSETGTSGSPECPCLHWRRSQEAYGNRCSKVHSGKKYGIQTGEPVAMALRKCPDLVIVKSDFELYIKCSRAFKEICASYAPVMESFSIDEVLFWI